MRTLESYLLILFCISALLQHTHSDCVNADTYECQTSQCSTFSWSNGKCQTASTSCTVNTQVYNGNTCITCSSLPASSCSLTCPDYYFNYNTGTCTPCRTTYGANCIVCSLNACTQCSYSSNTVLASDSLSCVSPVCGSNCLQCYTSGGKSICLSCMFGYSVNSDYGCSVATCSIPQCNVCATATTCSLCAPGYSPSDDQVTCSPICSDNFCVNCIRP